MCITLIWFPLYRYPVSVQVFFCVNITTFGLLTAGVVLCYSRVRVCIKGTLNLSLDILCWVCLRLARGSYTGSHTRVHVNIHTLQRLTTRVACGKPLRLWLTTVCRLCQPVFACEYYRLTPWAPCVRLRWALILTRGGAVVLCLLLVLPPKFTRG